MANRTLTYLTAAVFASVLGCDSAKDENMKVRLQDKAPQKQAETNKEIHEKQQPNFEVYERARLISEINVTVKVTDPITGKKTEFPYQFHPGFYYRTDVKGSKCKPLPNEDKLEARVSLDACDQTGDGVADFVLATKTEPGVYDGKGAQTGVYDKRNEKRAPVAAPVWAEYRVFPGLCYTTNQAGSTKPNDCGHLDSIRFDVPEEGVKATMPQPPAEAPAP